MLSRFPSPHRQLMRPACSCFIRSNPIQTLKAPLLVQSSYPTIAVVSFFAATTTESTRTTATSTHGHSRRQAAWNRKLDEFKQFVDQHGHARVPQSHPKLGRWVNRVRKEYKQGKLSRERIASLDQVGFVWDSGEAMWMDYYKELCLYYKEHGHCLVPTSDKTLDMWIRKTRHEYHKYQHNITPCSMTPIRIELLNSINFRWDARDSAWNERYNELQEFVNVNGLGCLPPRKTHPSLLDWLSYQKKLYRDKQKGKTVSLTEERIAQLRQLGFILD